MPVQRIRQLEESWTADQIRNHPDSVIGSAVRAAAGDSGAGIPAGAGSAVRLATIPGVLANQRRDQQSTYSQDNVVTAPDGTFYTITLDEQQRAIARKFTPAGVVIQSFDMSTLAGNPFGVQGDDSHNTWVIGIDHLGKILVAGNTRGTTARIAYTTTPGDLSTFSFIANPLPSAYDSLSYPTLVQKGNGRLAYAAGQGYAAGGRSWFWAEWNGNSFAAPQVLVDGIVSGEGAYLHRFAIRGNKIALFFMWRSGVNADWNVDFGYAESLDGGITWRKISGAAQQMPITHANADTIIPFGYGSGAINQGGADIDPDGHPHAALMQYDSAGKTQIHHVWHDGTAWHNDRVTNLTARVETVGQNVIAELSVARPQLFCANDGRTIIIERLTYDGYGGRPVGIDVTPGADRTPFRLADLDLSGWEPAYDQRAVREHGTLRMLITSIDHQKSSKQGWVAQWGGILSIDLERIGEVQSGAAPLPTIRVDTVMGIPTNLAAVANTAADTEIAELGELVIPADQYMPGRRYFARVSGRFDLLTSESNLGAYIALREQSSGADLCRLNLVQQSVAGYRATPWEPIPVSLMPAQDATRRSIRLASRGYSQAGVAGVRVRGYRLEIGYLDWT